MRIKKTVLYENVINKDQPISLKKINISENVIIDYTLS